MEARYNKLNRDVVKELINIVGEDAVIYDDEEKLGIYAYDEATQRNKEFQQMPEAVVKAGSPEEISQILKLANIHKVPVTPRGAGSGLSGGAVPIYKGIVLSVERMNRILEVDTENLMAVVETGVITNDLNKKVVQEGLFYAGYPMSFETCFIGGNIAHNAGGGRAVKYGVTSHHVLGLEVVLPTGEIVNYGGKRIKDVTGYNMVQLMLGSEGTLGIITKAILKLLPHPKARVVMTVMFKDLRSVVSVVPKIIGELRIVPVALEFMDGLSMDITYNFLGVSKPNEEARALLIVETDGDDMETAKNQCLKIGEFCMERGALDAFIAETPKEQEKMWRVRIANPEALQQIRGAVSPLIEDITVPIANIPSLVEKVYELSQKYNVLTLITGHGGDGNVHVLIAKSPEITEEKWETVVPELLTELYSYTRELGGTISGEHGIAHKRKRYMPLVMSEEELDSMRKIKKALDPNNILNPGKKFDV